MDWEHLYRLARRAAQSENVVEDVAQDALLEAYQDPDFATSDKPEDRILELVRQRAREARNAIGAEKRRAVSFDDREHGKVEQPPSETDELPAGDEAEPPSERYSCDRLLDHPLRVFSVEVEGLSEHVEAFRLQVNLAGAWTARTKFHDSAGRGHRDFQVLVNHVAGQFVGRLEFWRWPTIRPLSAGAEIPYQPEDRRAPSAAELAQAFRLPTKAVERLIRGFERHLAGLSRRAPAAPPRGPLVKLNHRRD